MAGTAKHLPVQSLCGCIEFMTTYTYWQSEKHWQLQGWYFAQKNSNYEDSRIIIFAQTSCRH